MIHRTHTIVPVHKLRPRHRAVIGRVVMTFNIQEVTNEQLIAEVQQGHQRALSDLYDRFVNRVYGMALQKLADPVEAQNVTHDIFVMIWQRSANFRPIVGSAAGWLLTEAHNYINGEYRRKRLVGEIQEALSYDPNLETGRGEDITEGREEAALARQALQSLPDEEREVVVLSYYQGNSQSEISRRLGVPLDTVKSRMRSALTRLRTALIAGGVEK